MAESAAFSRVGRQGGCKASTLDGAVNSSATTLTGADLTTWAGATTNGPITWTMSRGNADEESGEATGVSGNNLTGVTRGLFGTSAQAHSSGVTLELTSSKRDFDEANYWVAELAAASNAAGDLLYSDGADSLTRLAIGTARQQLATNAGATAPEWVASLQSLLTATGDIIRASAANTPQRLAIGSTGDVLTVAGGVPTWAAPAGSTPANDDATVATLESTTSTTFTDLTTSGPAVTVVTGTRALVIISAGTNTTSTDPSMGVAVSGASTIAASAAKAWFCRDAEVGVTLTPSYAYIEEGLTAGSNIFTAKYKGSGGTASFDNRRISVINMGS